MTKTWRWLALAALSGAGYFLSARLAYAFALQPSGISVVWVPTGLMLGLLMLHDRRQWAALLAGGFAGNVCGDLQHGLSLTQTLLGGVANALEVAVAATVIHWGARGPLTLSSLRQVTALIVGGALVSNAVTSLAGGAVIAFGGSSYWRGWFVWWTGDGMGMLVVTPAVVTWVAFVRRRPAFRWRPALESGAVFGALAALSHFILSQPPSPASVVSADPYMVFLLLFWAAFRFGLAGASTASLLLAAITIWNAAQGRGPFSEAGYTATNQVLQIYFYLTLSALTALIVAAIVDERRASEDLRARLVSILNAAPDFITIGRLDGAPLYINPAARRALAIGPEEEVDSLLPYRPAGFPDFLQSTIAPACVRDGSWRGETDYISRSGRTIPVSQVTVAHPDSTGAVAYLSTISRDMTDRLRAERALREAEERLRFALKASGVGVWEANLQTGAAFWSDTCEMMHGLLPGEFAGTIDAFLTCVHPDDRERVKALVDTGVREWLEFTLEYRSRWPDGTDHDIRSTGRFVRSANDELRGAGIAIDITLQRSLEAQLRQSQKMDAIGQLAGGIAHDFNNLLTAILGYAVLLGDSLSDGDPRRADLLEIRRAAERAASLTRQLLAFSRRQILEPRVLRLGDVVAGLTPMLRRLLGETIDLKAVIRDRRSVLADAGQMEQVLVNIAVNARDAMPNGGYLTIETADVHLDESYRALHSDGRFGAHVMIAVSDTGEGMDVATQQRAFEPFFTTKPKGQGTGLGLATVHGIVTQSGGTIELYTEPGHGTTFRIYLPISESAPESLGTDRMPIPPRASAVALLVEDEQTVRDFVERVLTGHGYVVHTCATPQQAVSRAVSLTAPIDVVLTDVILPEMDGRTMAEQVRQHHAEARVLYMSGYTDTAIVRHGVLEPGVWFIQKPFTAPALLHKLHGLLRQANPPASGVNSSGVGPRVEGG